VKILVTAGPTREFFDDIRFLSNPSSGKMGYEIASAGARAGHEVILVSGPVSLKEFPEVETIRVVSSEQMAEACLERYAGCDAVVMTAAVCDYRPKQRHAGKMKKKTKAIRIELVPTTDILSEMGKRKKGQLLVGFALEVQDARENATAKLAAKNLDYIVLNSPGTFAEDTISCEIIDSQGRGTRRDNVPKRTLAEEIISLLELGHRGNT
jgi:phosphopantothenoylcysteine decarboxylase/phosphopantothenate--cysteine ligase